MHEVLPHAVLSRSVLSVLPSRTPLSISFSEAAPLHGRHAEDVPKPPNTFAEL
jgi:hypothetical protein